MFHAMPLRNTQLGAETVLSHPDLVNLYRCSIGDGTKIRPFVEIQKNSHLGARRIISSDTFICEGATIEGEADWSVLPTRIRGGASIGSEAVIVCGTTVGRYAIVGAARDVPGYAIVAGAPPKVVGDVRDREDLPTPARGTAVL
jgi:acetyltransferase-like isoleucine patch superfamily enzyme